MKKDGFLEIIWLATKNTPSSSDGIILADHILLIAVIIFSESDRGNQKKSKI